MSVYIHKVFNRKPDGSERSISNIIERAEKLRQSLPNRVLPFAEDWDLVILADEIKRLRNLL
jgi:hypothetical protein